MTHSIDANDPAKYLLRIRCLLAAVSDLHQSHDANDSSDLQRSGSDETQFLPQIDCRETAVHIQLVQDVLAVIADG